MRWSATFGLACALVIAASAPALACDPEWDWCGYDWYEPSWYEPYLDDVPAYEEPSWSWTWWEAPAYEPIAVAVPTSLPSPVHEPAPVYEAAPADVPATVYGPAPVYEPAPAYQPVVAIVSPAEPGPAPQATWSDPYVPSIPSSDLVEARVAPAPQPAPTPIAVTPIAVAPDPDARRAELGLHWVTQVHAGDTVTTQGLVTTYSSISVSSDAGTAARLVASVGTGEASSYDGALWNGRMSLSDGRSVKGQVYANYVWNGSDWVLDRYVFFQDDLEVARLAATPTPAPATPTFQPPSTAVSTSPRPVVPVTVSVPIPTAASAPAFVTPLTGDSSAAPGPASIPSGPATSQPVPRVVRAGIALAPQADPLGRVEVLRGRRVPLWVRATIDGLPARVVGWELVSGELTALGPISGDGDDPLVATWRSISGPGAAFSVLLRASVDVPSEGLREVDATIDVVVRSPALVD